MNSLKNNIQLIGRLGKDPEIIHLTSGKTLIVVTYIKAVKLIRRLIFGIYYF